MKKINALVDLHAPRVDQRATAIPLAYCEALKLAATLVRIAAEALHPNFYFRSKPASGVERSTFPYFVLYKHQMQYAFLVSLECYESEGHKAGWYAMCTPSPNTSQPDSIVADMPKPPHGYFEALDTEFLFLSERLLLDASDLSRQLLEATDANSYLPLLESKRINFIGEL